MARNTRTIHDKAKQSYYNLNLFSLLARATRGMKKYFKNNPPILSGVYVLCSIFEP